MNEIKTRNVDDFIFAVVDGLKGSSNAMVR
jgi:transposase-like protein